MVLVAAFYAAASAAAVDVPLLERAASVTAAPAIRRISCASGSLRDAFEAAGEGTDPLEALDAAVSTRVDLYALPTGKDCAITVATQRSGLVGAVLLHHGTPFLILRWQGAYYDADGAALSGAMLARPLPISRVTSRWGERFHPVTHEQKKHQGVDYGAAVGTPVWAVADGRVLTAGFDAVAGNNLRLIHGDDVVTRYLHLSAFADGIRANATVKRGQVIGYVGGTGRVTGPHLHFEVIKWGRVTDPLEEERPAGPRLSEFQCSAFDTDTAQLRAALLQGQR